MSDEIRMGAALIAELNDLLRLDYDPIGAYTIAIGTVESTTYRETLQGLLRDHKRHVRELTELVCAAGGTPAEGPHASTGAFKLAVQAAGAAADGDRALILAFKANEGESVEKYRVAAERAHADDVRRVLQRAARDEESHYEWAESRLKRLGTGPNTALGKAEAVVETVHGKNGGGAGGHRPQGLGGRPQGPRLTGRSPAPGRAPHRERARGARGDVGRWIRDAPAAVRVGGVSTDRAAAIAARVGRGLRGDRTMTEGRRSVVLLGDSIFDNAAYTRGGPHVAAHWDNDLPMHTFTPGNLPSPAPPEWQCASAISSGSSPGTPNEFSEIDEKAAIGDALSPRSRHSARRAKTPAQQRGVHRRYSPRGGGANECHHRIGPSAEIRSGVQRPV